MKDKIKGRKRAPVTASRVKHMRSDMRSDQRDINSSRGLQTPSETVVFLDFAHTSVCMPSHVAGDL